MSAVVTLRQVVVAAFAVSGYSSTYYRAGSKPFNPLLGESYECIREDKGFCFFSEQVCVCLFVFFEDQNVSRYKMLCILNTSVILDIIPLFSSEIIMIILIILSSSVH